MIFAPVIRRSAFTTTPRAADLALQRFLVGTVAAPTAAQSAGCTVTRGDNSTTLQLDVPGLSREQLDIRIEGNQVRLNSVDGAPRTVRRAWELPQDIDAAASSAKLEHGVLTLTLAHVVPVSQATSLRID